MQRLERSSVSRISHVEHLHPVWHPWHVKGSFEAWKQQNPDINDIFCWDGSPQTIHKLTFNGQVLQVQDIISMHPWIWQSHPYPSKKQWNGLSRKMDKPVSKQLNISNIQEKTPPPYSMSQSHPKSRKKRRNPSGMHTMLYILSHIYTKSVYGFTTHRHGTLVAHRDDGAAHSLSHNTTAEPIDTGGWVEMLFPDKFSVLFLRNIRKMWTHNIYIYICVCVCVCVTCIYTPV